MRVLALVALVGVLTGCATLPDIVSALAKDQASVCVSVKAMLYGHVTICRTNTNGAAALAADANGGIRLQHSGTRVP